MIKINTKQLGLLGELKAQYDFIKNGYEVSLPLGDYCAYDLIVLKDNKVFKIQVKSCEKIIDGKINFNLTSANYYCNKQYTLEDCDYFYLFCYENEQSYLLKNINIENNRGITLRIEPTKNNQIKGIKFAKDYLFDITYARMA